ncbi:MAG: hypothetical protein U0S48_16525 [Solirubrobacteraceae bacterium]
MPVAERVAVVDNDGTLWCEQPAYLQALFILERLGEQAAADPRLAARPVVQALLAGDLAAATQDGPGLMLEVLLDTHAGLTTEEFEEAVADWIGLRLPPPALRRAGLRGSSTSRCRAARRAARSTSGSSW